MNRYVLSAAASMALALSLPAQGQEMPFPSDRGVATTALPNDCAPPPPAPPVVWAPPVVPDARPAPTAESGPAPPAVANGTRVMAPARDELIKLEPVVILRCRQGRIEAHLSGDVWRNFPSFAKIPVRLELFVASGVKVNLNTLDTIDNGSGFVLASPPRYNIVPVEGGVKVSWLVVVQSTNAGDKLLPLRLSLKYAVDSAPDGTPLWLDAVTPDLVFMRHDSAPAGVVSGLTAGNTSKAIVRTSWAYVPSLVIGVTCLGLVALLAGLRRVNRLRPRPALSPGAATWLELDDLVKSGRQLARKNESETFDSQHYKLISRTLKAYLRAAHPQLGALSEDLSTWKWEEVVSTLTDAPSAEAKAIAGAMKKLTAVVYGGQRLSAMEHRELLAELGTIVPRPLTL